MVQNKWAHTVLKSRHFRRVAILDSDDIDTLVLYLGLAFVSGPHATCSILESASEFDREFLDAASVMSADTESFLLSSKTSKYKSENDKNKSIVIDREALSILCTTTTVQSYLVDHQPTLRTTKTYCAQCVSQACVYASLGRPISRFEPFWTTYFLPEDHKKNILFVPRLHV